MIVLKIIGWILLALLLLLLLLLCLPASLGISGGNERKFDIWVKFAGVRIWRKKDKEPQQDQPKTSKKKTDFSATVKNVVQLVRLILGQLPRLWGKWRVKKLHLVCIAANEDAADAALEYGAACGVIYPLLDYIKQNMHLSERHSDVEIRCDFERQKPLFEIESEISMSTRHIVIFVLRVLSKKIMEDIADE